MKFLIQFNDILFQMALITMIHMVILNYLIVGIRRHPRCLSIGLGVQTPIIIIKYQEILLNTVLRQSLKPFQTFIHTSKKALLEIYMTDSFVAPKGPDIIKTTHQPSHISTIVLDITGGNETSLFLNTNCVYDRPQYVISSLSLPICHIENKAKYLVSEGRAMKCMVLKNICSL